MHSEPPGERASGEFFGLKARTSFPQGRIDSVPSVLFGLPCSELEASTLLVFLHLSRGVWPVASEIFLEQDPKALEGQKGNHFFDHRAFLGNSTGESAGGDDFRVFSELFSDADDHGINHA